MDFSRLIQALELNISNGMRIQDALDVSKNITNNDNVKFSEFISDAENVFSREHTQWLARRDMLNNS